MDYPNSASQESVHLSQCIYAAPRVHSAQLTVWNIVVPEANDNQLSCGPFFYPVLEYTASKASTLALVLEQQHYDQ